MLSALAVAREANHAVTLKDAERAHILRTLEETRGVLGGPGGAAARLGLKRTTLQSLVKRLGIDQPSARRHVGTCRDVGGLSSSLASQSPSRDGHHLLLSATDGRFPGYAGVWHRACSDSLSQDRRTASHAAHPMPMSGNMQ